MNFQFPLESLLRLRRGAERAAQLRLAQVTAMLAEVHGQIEAVDRDAAMGRERVKEAMRQGLFGAEVQFEAEVAAISEERREEMVRRKRQIEEQHRVERLALEDARRQREILEKLREDQERAFIRDQTRRSQAQTDELFLFGSDR